MSRVDLRAFVAAERTEGLKANTITSHLAVLSALFAFARDDLDMPVTMPHLKSSERPRRDDAREHRILADDELAVVLAATGERDGLYFRAVAQTGARMGEALGLTRQRVDVQAATIALREQFDRYGELAPLKTRMSRRTIEVTRSLAAELALAGGHERVFSHLTHAMVDKAWRRALKRAGIADPQPTVHDLRHTHVSGLIADGWDPVEIAARIGDTLETTLRVYAHQFDARRRGEQRSRALEARYGAADGNPTGRDGNQQAVTDRDSAAGNVADLRAVRDVAR